ncbi:hypothetical protein BSFA1_81790 (plasmid) [Burkholderia sp. SFA1]|nr:hypothetical protein BSFA1_81790 [Burkholderia sp. SFA1]
MSSWCCSEEADFRLWIRELDPNLYSMAHRRACVWQDELSGEWCWEIESFHGSGHVASGKALSREEAIAAADVAVATAVKAGGGS